MVQGVQTSAWAFQGTSKYNTTKTLTPTPLGVPGEGQGAATFTAIAHGSTAALAAAGAEQVERAVDHGVGAGPDEEEHRFAGQSLGGVVGEERGALV